MTLYAYLPHDRLRALADGQPLPDRTSGSTLFADISGFTPLTEALRESLGARRGAEELTTHLDAVYTALITQIERYGGSVIGFAGDAITCWFDDAPAPAAPRAVASALAMIAAMSTFAAIPLPDQKSTALSLKVAVTSGPARRFVVGDPTINYLDAIAGATVARASTAEHLALKGDVLIDEATAHALGEALTINDWRMDQASGERFAVITHFAQTVTPLPPAQLPDIDLAHLQPWLHSAVYAREVSGQGSFLTEFRPCVALFVRFTGLDYDADHAQAQLDAFVRRIQSCADYYEGALMDLTIGDKGSYAYINFGALSAHEDDARRAVKTALELSQAAATLNFLHPLQCGITKGTLRVGAFGGAHRRAYGALGDEVNLAARLMMTAAPGEILLSGRMHTATASTFVFEPRPPLPLKGKAEPLPVFAVTGERQHRAIRLQEPTYALPMVGRQHELARINERLELTLQGKSQVIGLVAPAGLGKSRLVAEVIRLARKKGYVGYGGTCQSDAINTPYQVWKSIWSAFFDVDPTAPLRKQIRSLEGEIEDRAPDRVEALPLLGNLLNLNIPENDFTRNLDPKYRQSTMRALLEDCLRAAATDEPVLIVIEDLHWIDALSHNLLEDLARTQIDSRVCFVLAYRPPELARLAAPRLEALPNFTKIELHELDAAESEQVIRAKLAQLYPERSSWGSGVPIELANKLLARSQGNPFYLEELLNFLHDRGLDPRDPTALEKIELPDSLHTLILSRIDQLSEREKTTLRVASVIGRLFRAHWLIGYYPELGEAASVKDDLDQLAELDFTPLDTPDPELVYLFKHIVTHEVAYENLPFATRARLHARLARYLENQVASGALTETFLLDTLTYHYLRSEDTAKQREYLRKAGQAAVNMSAFNTALDYLTRLMELTPATDPARSAVTLLLATAQRGLGDYSAARDTARQAESAAITAADRAAALALLGNMTSESGDYATAQAILAEAVALARTSGDQLALSRALYALGAQYWRLGKLAEVRAAMLESLELARALGNVYRELPPLNVLATLAWQQGDMEAERLFQDVILRALEAGDRTAAMAAHNNLGVMADGRQDYQAARNYFQEVLALAREIGAQESVTLSLLNVADEEVKLGNFEAARAGSREGLRLALRLGLLPRVVQVVVNFSYLAYAEGQIDRALALMGLARHHPAWGGEHQREMEETLARWALNPVQVEAGLAQGAALDWDTTIQELLQD